MKNTLNCLILKRIEVLNKNKKTERTVMQYLIANGMNMGRWTIHFGVHCLADTSDTKSYLHIQHREHKDSIVENYIVQKQEKQISIINKKEFEDTINCSDRVARVMRELEGDYEIHNSQIVVNYSDEGYATFEIIMNKPEKIILSFIGTAA